MRLLKKIKVPTGEIYTAEGEKGTLEFLTVGDYGKQANIKADFLGITRELNGVPNGEVQPLTEKWVVTISTQYGCSMGCKFCDVPKVGPGTNATRQDMTDEVLSALEAHPEIKDTKRLNIHFARMGEPTWNPKVIESAVEMRRTVRMHFGHNVLIHPVVSTMLPANNAKLDDFLHDWAQRVKNEAYDGDAGLQFSINSTDDEQRRYLFSGSSLHLGQISDLADRLPKPKGRKYTLNFALADNSIIEGKRLASLFDPDRWICKITPLHRTSAAEQNNIRTTGGYEAFTPYKAVEDDLKAHGFDVIVFVPSYDEDDGLITCGNAILSGKLPSAKYEVTEY
jgi:23S rRNA (adenine2503-C2)-methyltransferase